MINSDGTHNARYTVYLGDWIVTQSMVTLGQAGHDRQAGSTALMIIPLLIMFLSCCFLFLFFGIKKKKWKIWDGQTQGILNLHFNLDTEDKFQTISAIHDDSQS